MRADPRGDAGFTVAEALVALMLFTLLSTVVGGTVTHAVGLTRGTEERVTASNLAAEHLELARAAVPKALVDAGTAVQDVTVGDVAYRVTRRIEPVTQSTLTSPGCEPSPDRSIALRVHVEVTWPDRPDRIAPVHVSTLRTVKVAEAFPATGILYVLVTDFNGAPAAGVSVTLTPGGLPVGTTNNDGCATFLDVPPGAGYKATLSKLGWVDPNRVAEPSRNYLVVRPASTSKTNFVFGPATSLLQPPASLTITPLSCVAAPSPTFVSASPAYENTSGATSLTMTKPSGVVAGNLMLAQVVVRGDSMTVTAPVGWNLVRFQGSGFTGISTGVWQRRATSSEPTTYTWTFPATAAIGGILAYRDVYAAAPVNVSGTATFGNGSPNLEAPSVTTTSQNTTLVAFWSGDAAGTLTVPASMTKRHEASSTWGQLRSAVAGQPIAAAGATGVRTASANTGIKGIGQTVALAPLRHVTVTVSWPETISTSANGYRLLRKRAGVVQRDQTVPGKTTTSATDTPLVSGLNYAFDLHATTATGTVSPAMTRFFTPHC